MENKGIKIFDQHLDERYGKVGSMQCTDFEIKAKTCSIGELITNFLILTTRFLN